MNNLNYIELKVEMLRHSDTGQELAKSMGIGYQTLSDKKKKKKDFKRSEIEFIKERYELNPERVDEIFFANTVS